MESPKPQEKPSWFAEQLPPHEPALRAYLHSKFPTLSDVDDVVQESYLKLLRTEKTVKISNTKAYFFSVARNVALGLFRKRKTLREIPMNDWEETGVLQEAAHVPDIVNASQEFSLVAEAIDRLPARCREVLALRMLHGCSHREIAQRLKIAEETVRVQVMRGLKKCTAFLRERGMIENSNHGQD